MEKIHAEELKNELGVENLSEEELSVVAGGYLGLPEECTKCLKDPKIKNSECNKTVCKDYVN